MPNAETKSSGAVACCTQISRSSPAYGLPLIPLTTGNAPRATAISATSSPIACATPAISGEWKACETSSGVTSMPLSTSLSDAALIPREVPETTVCFG